MGRETCDLEVVSHRANHTIHRVERGAPRRGHLDSVLGATTMHADLPASFRTVHEECVVPMDLTRRVVKLDARVDDRLCGGCVGLRDFGHSARDSSRDSGGSMADTTGWGA